MTEIEIRTYVESDLDAVVDLWQERRLPER
jgi:hypothetical protein